MRESIINIFKSFLSNQFVINWVAPIITGLIVVAIPTAIIRIFRIKKDEKKVQDANERYVNSIRPYIIQKIKIDSRLITDIRGVIINESCLKEKFIYSELELRNKLITDINENKYIDENSKYELIEFTYEIFKSFDRDKDLINTKKKNNIKLDKSFILLIISMFVITIVSLVDREGAKSLENPAIILSFVICLFLAIEIIISKLFESDVIEKKYYDYYDYYKILYNITKVKENKNSSNKNKK